MSSQDPVEIVNDSPMTWRQWLVVTIMILLNALDGFDVLSSAFAAPGISLEWGIPRSSLGIVLSAELVGMGFGSLILGGVADRMGRKTCMLICLVIMAIGMYMASVATGVTILTVWRFITGIGIGGMLTSTNAVTAECSSKSSRSLAMALYVIGYPLGGIVGGFAAQTWLLVDYDWRSVFLVGAIVTAVMIPAVMFLVPETPAFYAARRPENVVEKINRSLRALRLKTIEALPPLNTSGPQPKVTDILFKPGLRKITWLLSLAYMFHTLTFYFILKFGVQIVADSGYSQAQAASTLTFANIGGAIGGGLFGFLLKKWDIKGPTIAMSLLSIVAIAWFGMGHEELAGWRMAAFLTMFCLNAAIVGYYAAFARGFPAYARGTGTGFALGIGRAGAAGSPLLAGYLFDVLGKGELLTVSLIMCLGVIFAVAMLLMLPALDGDEAAKAG